MLRAQLAAHIEPVHVGEHQVEHQRIERFAREALEPRAAGSGDGNTKPRLAEVLGHHLGEPGIVFDQENAFGHASLGPPSGYRTIRTVRVAGLRRKLRLLSYDEAPKLSSAAQREPAGACWAAGRLEPPTDRNSVG